MPPQVAPHSGRFFYLLAYTFGFLGVSLGVLAWLMPNHYLPWTSFHNEAMAFAAITVLAFATLVGPKGIAPPPVASLLVLSLIVLLLLQHLSGMIGSAGDAWVSSLYLVGLALALWLGSEASQENCKDGAITLYSTVIVIGACVSTYIALLQWLRVESTWGIFAAERGPGMRPFGNLGQPNHLATLTLMACALSALLFLKGRIRHWQLWTLLAFLSFGMTLTESRGGRLGVIVMGVFLLWKSRDAAHKGFRKGVWIWWSLTAFMSIVFNWLNEVLLLQPGRDALMTKDDARAVMWGQMWAAIEHSPWIGYGWRQTMVAQKTGALSQSGNLVTDYAHNFMLDLLLWVGVPAGLLLILTTFWWLIRLAQKVERPNEVLIFVSVLPFFIHSQLEFPFAYAYFLFSIGLALGFLSTTDGRSRHNPYCIPTSWLKGALAISAIGFGTLSAAVGYEYLLAEEDFRVMRFELRKVGHRPLDYEAPKLIWLTQLNELLKAGRIKPSPDMLKSDIDLLQRVNQSQGWATLHLSLVVALGLNGQPKEASDELLRLRALYGEVTYRQAIQFFSEMRSEPRYEALQKVQIPEDLKLELQRH